MDDFTRIVRSVIKQYVVAIHITNARNKHAIPLPQVNKSAGKSGPSVPYSGSAPMTGYMTWLREYIACAEGEPQSPWARVPTGGRIGESGPSVPYSGSASMTGYIEWANSQPRQSPWTNAPQEDDMASVTRPGTRRGLGRGGGTPKSKKENPRRMETKSQKNNAVSKPPPAPRGRREGRDSRGTEAHHRLHESKSKALNNRSKVNPNGQFENTYSNNQKTKNRPQKANAMFNPPPVPRGGRGRGRGGMGSEARRRLHESRSKSLDVVRSKVAPDGRFEDARSDDDNAKNEPRGANAVSESPPVPRGGRDGLDRAHSSNSGGGARPQLHESSTFSDPRDKAAWLKSLDEFRSNIDPGDRFVDADSADDSTEILDDVERRLSDWYDAERRLSNGPILPKLDSWLADVRSALDAARHLKKWRLISRGSSIYYTDGRPGVGIVSSPAPG